MKTLPLPAIALSLIGASALAQPGTIITERPGFSTSPQSLAQGYRQIELGISYNLKGETGQIPLFLGRYGIDQKTEVQFGWNGTSFGTEEDLFERASGFSVGVKRALSDGSRTGFTTGVIGTLFVPSGDDAADQVDGVAGFLWTNQISPDATLFGTLTAGTTSFGEDRRGQFSNAIGVSLAAGDKRSVFIEHYVQKTENVDSTVQYIDAGISHLITNNLQVDITGGVSVGDIQAGAFLGAGIARRF